MRGWGVHAAKATDAITREWVKKLNFPANAQVASPATTSGPFSTLSTHIGHFPSPKATLYALIFAVSPMTLGVVR